MTGATMTGDVTVAGMTGSEYVAVILVSLAVIAACLLIERYTERRGETVQERSERVLRQLNEGK